MRRFYFPVIVYTALAVICLLYASMAFVDLDLSLFVSDFDPFKLIMGLGGTGICVHSILRYIKLSKM